MPYETIIYEKWGGLVDITLNRPDRLNAANLQLAREMTEAVGEIEADDEVRVMILHGAGRAFCAGADIKAMAEGELSGELVHKMTALCTRMEGLSKITVAAVNGVAAGGGCEMALACDLRLAADVARFGLPEVTLGLLPGSGGTQRLPRIIGAGRAKWVMYTGDLVDAETALQWGLVNQVVPGDQLLEEAGKLAQMLMERPPLALHLIKSCIDVGSQMDLRSGLEYEARCIQILEASEDAQEGLRAFIEKRAGNFKGR
ncbi:MAG: enoyl-CoA hydratase/isomerase family protein [Dehalococcoidia bacterium]|nr:enoyl-CoA hydratase/isomerase family protein [Dehalococcoidia bacterium]